MILFLDGTPTRLYRSDDDGANRQPVPILNVDSESDIAWPEYGPDGSFYYYTCPRGTAGNEAQYGQNVLWRYADGQSRKLLDAHANGWTHHGHVAACADGRLTMFAVDSKGAKVVVTDKLGRKPRVVFAASGKITDPSWSPDGTKIAFAINDRVAVLTVATRACRVLPYSVPYPLYDPYFLPDGQTIVALARFGLTPWPGTWGGVLLRPDGSWSEFLNDGAINARPVPIEMQTVIEHRFDYARPGWRICRATYDGTLTDLGSGQFPAVR